MSDLPIFQRKADEEIAQLKQRIEQLERERDFMRGELIDSYCMNPIWLDEQIEQLRKQQEDW